MPILKVLKEILAFFVFFSSFSYLASSSTALQPSTNYPPRGRLSMPPPVGYENVPLRAGEDDEDDVDEDDYLLPSSAQPAIYDKMKILSASTASGGAAAADAPSGKSLVTSSWACAACTFENDGSAGSQCLMCGTDSILKNISISVGGGAAGLRARAAAHRPARKENLRGDVAAITTVRTGFVGGPWAWAFAPKHSNLPPSSLRVPID